MVHWLKTFGNSWSSSFHTVRKHFSLLIQMKRHLEDAKCESSPCMRCQHRWCVIVWSSERVSQVCWMWSKVWDCVRTTFTVNLCLGLCPYHLHSQTVSVPPSQSTFDMEGMGRVNGCGSSRDGQMLVDVKTSEDTHKVVELVKPDLSKLNTCIWLHPTSNPKHSRSTTRKFSKCGVKRSRSFWKKTSLFEVFQKAMSREEVRVWMCSGRSKKSTGGGIGWCGCRCDMNECSWWLFMVFESVAERSFLSQTPLTFDVLQNISEHVNSTETRQVIKINNNSHTNKNNWSYTHTHTQW